MEDDKYFKRQIIYKAIMLVIITAFLTFIITTICISNRYSLSKTGIQSLIKSSTAGNNLSAAINNIQLILDEHYLRETDREKSIEGAIKGYVEALGDPYTQYITKDEMEEFAINITGNYVGIGIYMAENTKDNTIEILMPIEGGPAEEAGILPGDKILSVDGIEYKGKDIDIAADKIKGEKGTTVKLKILREQEIKNFEIIRRKVETNPVTSEKLENDIGYIQVTSFDQGTAESFKSKYEDLKKQGIKSLIIDLRNNGGGMVETTLQIAECIVPKGQTLLITVDKDKKETVEKSSKNPIIDMPIVVLVNENSASASEILAGALKDHQKATIVGTTTFGKGVIQEVIEFSDGSALKVTVQEYYTPNKNKIHEVGVSPDIVVELSKDEDTQLNKAIEILK